MTEREVAIRAFTGALLARLDESPPSPVAITRYARVAVRWESLRLRLERGVPTPGDDARFQTLTAVLRNHADALGLPTCVVGDDAAVAGVTDSRGFLPGDPARILSAESWRSTAAAW